MKQIGWSNWRFDVQFSKSPREVYRRFYVTRTTRGYTVVDKVTGDLTRVSSDTAAHAWAGMKVGEECIRH